MLFGAAPGGGRIAVAHLQHLPNRYYTHLLILAVACFVAVVGGLQRSVNLGAFVSTSSPGTTTAIVDPARTGAAAQPGLGNLLTSPVVVRPDAPVNIPQAPESVQPKVRTEIVLHIVQQGETVREIGEKYGISTDTVKWANDLDDPDQIVVGQELKILPVSGVLHKVREGDTLVAIAARYSTESSAVAEYNRFENADNLLVGQYVIVPGGRMPEPAPVTIPTYEYTIQAGESIVSIAARFDVNARSIVLWNGLRDASLIRPGDTLVIPGVSGPPAAAASSGSPSSAAPARSASSGGQPAAPAQRSAPAAVPRSPLELDIANYALQFVGYPYIWGATGPRGFDCSGFVWYVMKQKGVGISRDMWGMFQSGSPVSQDQLRPGDVVFFVNTYQAGLSHVGIYIGGGQFVNAQSESTGVIVASMSNPYWASRYYGARRY